MAVPFPRGIFAPMCTPFIDGELDLDRARRHAATLVLPKCAVEMKSVFLIVSGVSL